MGERDGQAPRAGIEAARQVIDLLHRLMRHVVVIFQLVGNLGDTRAGDGTKVVIPPVDPLTRFAIIRGPAKIGGVDVGGQTLFKAVQLVGADKVHLAGQRGLVARATQVMGIGRDIRGELCRVVINPGAARQGARHEGGTGRGAQRRGGIGVGKAHRAGGEFFQVRRMQEFGRTILEQGAGQLVDHQDQDIGAFGHSGTTAARIQPWVARLFDFGKRRFYLHAAACRIRRAKCRIGTTQSGLRAA